MNIFGYTFLLFSFFYLLRIFLSIINPNEILYMSTSGFLFYFLSFVFLPFFLLHRVEFSEIDYHCLFKGFIWGGLGFALLFLLFYSNYIGVEHRISQVLDAEDYISPLALSYVSTLIIGIILCYFLFQKNTVKQIFFYLIIIGLNLILFFLGASRGSLFSLFVPFLLYFLFSRSFNKRVKLVFVCLAFVLMLIFMTNFLGTVLYDRFFNLEQDIETESSSTIRLIYWEKGMTQFIDNPLFGNSLQRQSFGGGYPHNIIVEVFMSTGILGGLPFIIFLSLIIKKCIYIIRNQPEHTWITVVFFQSFMQNMFSGAIWNASWLALGAALVVGFKFKNKDIKCT